MKIPHRIKEKLLPILISRTAVFFFLMCLITLFLYAIGTNQGFIDSTQISLLRLYSVLGIFLVGSSIGGIAVNAVRFSRQKKARYLLRAGLYLLLALFGTVTVIFVMFVLALSPGNY